MSVQELTDAVAIFVAKEWRGRLSVESMRAFASEEDAVKYLREIEKETTDTGRYASRGGDVAKGWVRVYVLFAGEKPINITKKMRELALGRKL